MMRAHPWRGIVAEYRDQLPLPPDVPAITLLEGNTPLCPALRAGGDNPLYLKVEGSNPTGSFKDRGMTVAVTAAVAQGARFLVCASTGNTSASAAAFAARAGMPALVVVPAGEGAVARGKLAQAVAAGARVVMVRGNFDQALAAVRDLVTRRPDAALVNSVNPLRLEGQKTGAFEVVEQLGDAPDWLCIPVGNAGNISAYWMGFCAYYTQGRALRRPRLLGVQAAGAAPLVEGRWIDQPKTIASAIRIGHPASADLAKSSVVESKGHFLAVSDEQILEAYRFLSVREGVFCEPASAASLAGFWEAQRTGWIAPGESCVCVLTGTGLKDPERALAVADSPVEADPTAEDLLRALPPALQG